MKLKHLLILPALSVMGCQDVQESRDMYDKYPMPEGDREEMTYAPAGTKFALWAPTAEEVSLKLYAEGLGGEPTQVLSMTESDGGMWRTEVGGDLNGQFYTFDVKVDGAWLGDTPGVWAKAVGVNGDRAAILDLDTTDPEGWASDARPALESFADIVLYEMHHRDFSIDSLSGIAHRGKFLALTEEGTKSASGQKTGIDHLKELGVTHVHILPSFDYSSVDETKLDQPQYNWGYDPKNYNAPEGSYSTNPYDPATRIREFKQMVMALHRAGIRVVMDVVYNHTAVTEGSNFERTVPGYFYRQKPDGSFADASGCGNETASERAMMRRYMVESVKYWVNEYHVDGFRFDLMGIHDLETMRAIRQALDEIDPTIYIYGEGWAAGAPQLPADSLAMKNNIDCLARIAAFSDEYRDSLRGPFGNDAQGAFLAGLKGHEAGIRFGIAGGVEHSQVNAGEVHRVPKFWALQPTQFISYVSCHDDMCLADRLKATLPDASAGVRKALHKLAETAVLTSQGVPFIFAGDEVMRDKQGVHNSFNSPDSINTIRWALKKENRDVFDYVSGLIAMRRAHPAFRLGDADQVREHLEFLSGTEDNVVAFRLKGQPAGDTWKDITVILNARDQATHIDLPEGTWQVVCRDGKINPEKGLGTMQGGQVSVAQRSALIVHQ